MKFHIKDFFLKCDKIGNFRRIWSHLLKKSFMLNFIFIEWFLFYSKKKTFKIGNYNIYRLLFDTRVKV